MSVGKFKVMVFADGCGSAARSGDGGAPGRHWSSTKDISKHGDGMSLEEDSNIGSTGNNKVSSESGRSYSRILRTLRRKLPWNSSRSCGGSGGGGGNASSDDADIPASGMKSPNKSSSPVKGRGAICPMPTPIISSAAHQFLRRLGVTRDQTEGSVACAAVSSSAMGIEEHRTVIVRRQSIENFQSSQPISCISVSPLPSNAPANIDHYYPVANVVGNAEASLESDAASKNNNNGGGLTLELFRLARYGWYWGPITRGEAEEKLSVQTDGAFLVRDSSDDRYLLSLSFRSFGKTLHTRIEHCNGVFSFYAQPESEGHDSIVSLIEHSMSYSQSGVFCYSRARTPGAPSYPVRLTKPVSRFMEVRSLQYLCRFVIRQYTRVDRIQELPLPLPIRGYIEEGHY